jgi:hypothetical protein
VMNAVETERSGIASGINNSVSRVAGLLAIAVLGIIMAAVFNMSLDRGLTRIDLTPQERQVVDSQRARLAAAELPASLNDSQRAMLAQAIDESFVVSFRATMLIASGLALLSAISAAVLIDGRRQTAAAGAPQPEPSAAL